MGLTIMLRRLESTSSANYRSKQFEKMLRHFVSPGFVSSFLLSQPLISYSRGSHFRDKTRTSNEPRKNSKKENFTLRQIFLSARLLMNSSVIFISNSEILMTHQRHNWSLLFFIGGTNMKTARSTTRPNLK
jgi:hypothetical protein